MKQELVVATKNRKKLKEIKQILKGLGLKITSLTDYPRPPKIVENCSTFKENAIKKAVKIAVFTKKLPSEKIPGFAWMPWVASRAFILRAFQAKIKTI